LIPTDRVLSELDALRKFAGLFPAPHRGVIDGNLFTKARLSDDGPVRRGGLLRHAAPKNGRAQKKTHAQPQWLALPEISWRLWCKPPGMCVGNSDFRGAARLLYLD